MSNFSTEENSNMSSVEALLDIMADLNERVLREQTLACINKEEFEQISEQFKVLDKNIFDHKIHSVDSNDRLEELVDIMSSIADLEFDEIAKVGEDYNHLDYIAISLNLMRERLAEKVAYLKCINNVFNSFHDLYIITNQKGTILHSNRVLEDKYEIHEHVVIGESIESFFESPEIKEKYSIDFTRAFGIHGISKMFIENENSKVVLRVSGSVYHDELGVERGYYYKIEPIYRSFYKKPVKGKTPDAITTLYDALKKLNSEKELNEKKNEVLESIAETYTDKTNLNFMEVMILNSVNQLLNKND